MDLVIALRFLKDGIRVCARCLFCPCAARKQRPGCNENHKQPGKHVVMSILKTTSQPIHRISDLQGVHRGGRQFNWLGVSQNKPKRGLSDMDGKPEG